MLPRPTSALEASQRVPGYNTNPALWSPEYAAARRMANQSAQSPVPLSVNPYRYQRVNGIEAERMRQTRNDERRRQQQELVTLQVVNADMYYIQNNNVYEFDELTETRGVYIMPKSEFDDLVARKQSNKITEKRELALLRAHVAAARQRTNEIRSQRYYSSRPGTFTRASSNQAALEEVERREVSNAAAAITSSGGSSSNQAALEEVERREVANAAAALAGAGPGGPGPSGNGPAGPGFGGSSSNQAVPEEDPGQVGGKYRRRKHMTKNKTKKHTKHNRNKRSKRKTIRR
jgi:hypothetical protein